MMDHFLNCHTEESIKIRFKSLSKQYHPDKNKTRDTTKIFQQILEQRDKALRAVWKKLGLDDRQIQERLQEFMIDYLVKGDRSGVQEMGEALGKQFFEQYKGDKEPTFTDVLKFVGKNVMGALRAIENPAAGRKKLDEQKSNDPDEKKDPEKK